MFGIRVSNFFQRVVLGGLADSNQATRNSKYRLLFDIGTAFRWDLFALVPPRLALVAFTISQPFLLNRFLAFLQDSNESVSVGYGLVAGYGFAFLGMAVSSFFALPLICTEYVEQISTGFYSHLNYRFITMLRGALVTAIYRKTTEVSIVALDNSAAVTLVRNCLLVVLLSSGKIFEPSH